jgi:DNA-binding NarL/FixJ family response regulator
LRYHGFLLGHERPCVVMRLSLAPDYLADAKERLPPMASIRALIVDDHPVTREGLRTALSMSDDAVVVVGEAASGEEAVTAVRELSPDVVFMDVRMPGMDGIEATRRIREASPETRVILITIDESRGAISDAIQAGVSGYLLKDASPEDLVGAARNAVEGNAVIHPQLTKTFIEEVHLAEVEGTKAMPLSKREREILQKVADGATTRQVATDLGISPHTVKTHLERIFEKLGANDRAQAVAIAIRTGIVR